ncbi:CHAT domain-containing protein [Streptomyces cyaneofuscatus]|uniref:CHAT domain-containing protein n=1 Tax=Streptomyces cyaneofuscatus TaxID=66883 RepID=UPI00365CA627
MAGRAHAGAQVRGPPVVGRGPAPSRRPDQGRSADDPVAVAANYLEEPPPRHFEPPRRSHPNAVRLADGLPADDLVRPCLLARLAQSAYFRLESGDATALEDAGRWADAACTGITADHPEAALVSRTAVHTALTRFRDRPSDVRSVRVGLRAGRSALRAVEHSRRYGTGSVDADAASDFRRSDELWAALQRDLPPDHPLSPHIADKRAACAKMAQMLKWLPFNPGRLLKLARPLLGPLLIGEQLPPIRMSVPPGRPGVRSPGPGPEDFARFVGASRSASADARTDRTGPVADWPPGPPTDAGPAQPASAADVDGLPADAAAVRSALLGAGASDPRRLALAVDQLHALLAEPLPDGRRGFAASILVQLLAAQFMFSEDLEDLERAVRCGDEQLALLPPTSPRYIELLCAVERHRHAYGELHQDESTVARATDALAWAVGRLPEMSASWLGCVLLYAHALAFVSWLRRDVTGTQKAVRLVELAARSLEGLPDRPEYVPEPAALREQLRPALAMVTDLVRQAHDQVRWHVEADGTGPWDPAADRVLVVSAEGVELVPLGVTEGQLAHTARRFLAAVSVGADEPRARRREATVTVFDILEWLWDSIAEPVLETAGLTCPIPEGTPRGAVPRLWWSASGPLAHLPLHAAGHHRAADGRSVLDRVASSYTPSIRALRHARQAPAARGGGGPFLAIRRPTGTGGRDGASVAEVEAMARTVAGLRTVEGEDATLGRVLAELSSAATVHFACHGLSDAEDPSRSHLELADGRLGVLDVARRHLPHAQLAVLLACHTARTDRLPDEAIHLTSAFLTAGYPQVVGALWEATDLVSVRMADRLYRALRTYGGGLDVTDTARAVHGIVRELRARHPASPQVWAPYVHTGR